MIAAQDMESSNKLQRPVEYQNGDDSHCSLFPLIEVALKISWTRDVFDRLLLAEAKISRQGFISANKNIHSNWRS